MTPHLSILLFAPLAVGLLCLLVGRSIGRVGALLASLVPAAFAVWLLLDYDARRAGLQYVTDDEWIPQLGVRYVLGVDGLNLWLIALTALLFAAAGLWLAQRPFERPALFSFHVALAETAVLGALLAQDLILFVLFFDLMLVPIYFLVGQWGSGERVAATTKLVIYTLVGSLLMLAAAIATGVLASEQPGQELSFALRDLAAAAPLLDETTQRWLFVGFALAFLIKMPAFPFQGWMPDGYRAMPLPVLVFFSGVVSKVAAYGFLRIVLPLLPDAAVDLQTAMSVLAIASIVYGSAQAFTQTDARLILGYSSMAQLGFITLGIFSLTDQGAQGGLIQMLNHGLVVAPVFFIIVLLAERAGGSEDIRAMGGIAFRAPVLAALFLVSALATLAIPGSSNFVGEFLILLGAFEFDIAIAVLASVGVVLASVYMLRMFIGAMHNRTGEAVDSRDLTLRDGLVIAPLVVLIVAFGLYPQGALEDAERDVRAAVRPVTQALAGGTAQPLRPELAPQVPGEPVP